MVRPPPKRLVHVVDTEGLVFDRGKSADTLRTVWALNELATLDSRDG